MPIARNEPRYCSWKSLGALAFGIGRGNVDAVRRLRKPSPRLHRAGRDCGDRPRPLVWVESGEAGLEFDRTKPGCRAAVAKLFQATEARWRTAREVRHPETCCRGGALLEPPAPRVRVDGKRPTVAGK